MSHPIRPAHLRVQRTWYIPLNAQIGRNHYPCSFMVLEHADIEFIFGLDMLRKHQVCCSHQSKCRVVIEMLLQPFQDTRYKIQSIENIKKLLKIIIVAMVAKLSRDLTSKQNHDKQKLVAVWWMTNMRGFCFIIAFHNFTTLKIWLTYQSPNSWPVVITMKKKLTDTWKKV